ncbi:MAG: hypothetical protein IT324_31875 [Anaerolineae bacterium]|nr:hypothetical protein [Anaerolineae bacterium]
MKKFIVVLVAIIAVGILAWPVAPVSAAAKTVTVRITEKDLNQGVPLTDSFGTVSFSRMDIQEGQLVVTASVKTQQGTTARVVMYVKANVRSGKMNWYVARATVNGRAVPSSLVNSVNKTFTPRTNIMMAAYINKYPNYKVTSVRLTRNTIIVTLTQNVSTKR